MKKNEIISLVLSGVILVVMGVGLLFLVKLKDQIDVLSMEQTTANTKMATLEAEIKLANGYGKANAKGIADLQRGAQDIEALKMALLSVGSSTLGAAVEGSEAFPYVEIWMDKNYTVNRTAEENGKGNLGWVVAYNGEVVLDRNAEGEMTYQYFRMDKGAYAIYMTDFVDGQYRVVSNVITYYVE